ncbi:unnamed protein product [Didymodactylos carnosus]|uniref:Uncharacterized protein n=1 Tax=Didymodactylos carnosus TaxID=1234261 RepID=A0A814DQK6_9BILA|nr:unnamed protein product [Didymodactylos carnosus]CAF0955989.1 unnamed protein product [Didymodactylos carnosus]CAF3723178.1 unnamed protein product [Didymodactylos carnosus]CAF3731049.1 unnamed protein product [Didymodactylos carnosus]
MNPRISCGCRKINRDEAGIMLHLIIEDLRRLECPNLFYLKFDGYLHYLSCYLMASVNDKPAQALIQNMGEPTALYGWQTIKTSKNGHVQFFSVQRNQQYQLRTNDEYVNACKELEQAQSKGRKRKVSMEDEKDISKGSKGSCELSTRTYFGRGSSFLCDSLHKLFYGLGKRVLHLWFSFDDKNEPWSMFYKTDQIQNLLSNFRYPSTTSRISRTINKYNHFKANEI